MHLHQGKWSSLSQQTNINFFVINKTINIMYFSFSVPLAIRLFSSHSSDPLSVTSFLPTCCFYYSSKTSPFLYAFWATPFAYIVCWLSMTGTSACLTCKCNQAGACVCLCVSVCVRMCGFVLLAYAQVFVARWGERICVIEVEWMTTFILL